MLFVTGGNDPCSSCPMLFMYMCLYKIHHMYMYVTSHVHVCHITCTCTCIFQVVNVSLVDFINNSLAVLASTDNGKCYLLRAPPKRKSKEYY